MTWWATSSCEHATSCSRNSLAPNLFLPYRCGRDSGDGSILDVILSGPCCKGGTQTGPQAGPGDFVIFGNFLFRDERGKWARVSELALFATVTAAPTMTAPSLILGCSINASCSLAQGGNLAKGEDGQSKPLTAPLSSFTVRDPCAARSPATLDRCEGHRVPARLGS